MKFETYVYKIVLGHQQNFHKDPCKDARARGVNASTRDEMRARVYASCALIFARIFGWCKKPAPQIVQFRVRLLYLEIAELATASWS